MKRILLPFSLFWLLVSPYGWTQQAEPFLFTTATSWYETTADRHWAWVQFQAPDMAVLQGRPLAVFSRPGDFDAVGDYELQSVIEPQLDPRVLGVLVSRGERLGGNNAELESDITNLFQDLNLDPSLSLSERISAVILGSRDDAGSYENLMLLSRKHPTLALAMGFAFAMPIEAGLTSFEIREWNAQLGQAGRILGRVKVEAGNPRILPAPVNPAEVEDTTPRGNLNTRMRWEEPDALKRLALLHFGYNIYRMDAEFAEAAGFDATPPTLAQLGPLLENNPALFQQVNRLPVMIPPDAGPEAAYYIDDNNAFAEGAQPLEDGDAFYYFISAQDLLGRSGHLSEGVLIQVCDRYPPKVPTDVRVERVRMLDPESGEPVDRLRIRWRQNPDDDRDTTTEYFIYKWDSFAEPGFRGNDLAQNLFTTKAHVPGETWGEILDDTVVLEEGNPQYIYTVRALDDSQCQRNASGHSGGGVGGLVSWEAPAAPELDVQILCLELEAVAKEVISFQVEEGQGRYTAVLQRPAGLRRIDWVEVRWAPVDNPPMETVDTATSLGRHDFRDGELEKRMLIPAPQDVPVAVFVRFGEGISTLSNWAVLSVAKNESIERQVDFVFEAQERLVSLPPGRDCRVHELPPPVEDGNPPPPEGDPIPGLIPVRIPVENWPEGQEVAEFHVFQQINNGRIVKIASVLTEEQADIVIDEAKVQIPVTCARVRFYVQSVGPEGHEGGLRETDDFFVGRQEAPVPIIRSPRSAGTALEPAVRIRWAVPPDGVEYFILYVGMETPPPDQISPEMSDNQLPPGSTKIFMVGGEEVELYAGEYMTGLLATGFGGPNPGEFELTIPVEFGEQMTFALASRTNCGFSDLSDAVQFQWTRPPDDGPDVPWPARDLPGIASADLFPGLESVWLPENAETNPLKLNQLAIRIGEFPWLNSYGDSKTPFFEFKGVGANFQQLLISGILNSEKLLPLVVYRRQLPSDTLPDVSGDVAQVSPLMEKIAYEISGEFTILRDPFVRALPEFGVAEPDFGYIYLLDTQPVIRGAVYQHIVVQFNERMEPVRVLPLDPVEVPE